MTTTQQLVSNRGSCRRAGCLVVLRDGAGPAAARLDKALPAAVLRRRRDDDAHRERVVEDARVARHARALEEARVEVVEGRVQRVGEHLLAVLAAEPLLALARPHGRAALAARVRRRR